MRTSPKAKCDLHIHSNFSDSDAKIEDIFIKAKEKNLSAIAITDHDTVSGLSEAEQKSKIYGIECIKGLELSAQKNDVEVHILGYFIDTKSKLLKESLAEIRALRGKRFIDMAQKLNSLGLNIDIDEVFLNISSSIPTRLHLGLHLVRKGIVKSLREAFNKYLSPGKPAYISRFKYSVKEAIELIKSCCGLAFLAHPYLLSEQAWIEEFASYGLDGLEVIYPRLSEAKLLHYSELADKLKLLKSGGSDAHGSYKEFTEVGGVTIPYEWVEEMKKRLALNSKPNQST
jgi:predicted metal-dependent phosphoesterase TrpH